MTQAPNRLYDLLPAAYRLRDADQGYPLRALMAVIAEQVDVVEDDIAQLYANLFIETAQDWAVPYIGELVGYRPVHAAGDPGPGTAASDQRRNRILAPRREVANTIRYRRRKGTLALLEQLVGDVADWPARAVEFYRLLGWLQHANHPRPQQGGTADLRRGDVLDLLGSPFDTLAHSVDVRRASSHSTQGRFNIPSIGLFVWRLKSYPVTQTPAYCLEEVGPQCYTFSVLGNELPLYTSPEPEDEPTHIAEELNLPAPIRRRALEERTLVGGRVESTQASAAYYGEGKSLTIWAPDWPRKGAGMPIPREAIVPADLTDWHYRAARGSVAVDPVLGRIVFPANRRPTQGVWVSYHYAFSADMGGGEYERQLAEPEGSAFYRVGRSEQFPTIKAALDQWVKDRPDTEGAPAARSGVIEIVESGVYTEQLNLSLLALETLQIRAASGARPVIRLLDYMAERPDAFSVVGGAGSRFTLDGLLVAGRGLRIYGADRDGDEGEHAASDLCDVAIRHCTFVPGWALGHDCEPKRPNEASIVLENTTAELIVEHSIVGTILVIADEVKADPNRISISDSIVDATSPELAAIGALTQPTAFGALTIARTTVIGQVQAHAIDLAENSIFYGLVRVARRQRGCVRFCWIAPGSRTPRRYACQPESAEAAAEDDLRAQAADTPGAPAPTPAEIEAARLRARNRVRPQFNSLRYGVPSYCQLAFACAEEITRGADDEAELGAFHDLFQPQREANLRARLDEYTPAGMDGGIFFVS